MLDKWVTNWKKIGIHISYQNKLQRNKKFKHLKNETAFSGSDDLLMRTCLSQRIFFIRLQKRRRGNTRSTARYRAQIPISWI